MATNAGPRSLDNPDDSQPSGLTAAERRQYIARLQQLHDAGYDISSQLGQGLTVDDNGRVVERGFWDRSKGDLARIGLLVGGGMLAGGLTSGAGTLAEPTLGGGSTLSANLGASSALPTATTVGATGGVTAGATSAGGTMAGTLPSTTTAGTLPSTSTVGTLPNIAGTSGITSGGGNWLTGLFRHLVKPIPGTNITPLELGGAGAGAIIQARQTSKAVQAQTDAANRALDLSRDVYQQQRSDLSPYRSIGNGATSTLANLMGLPMTDTPAVGSFAAQPTLSQLGSARAPSSGTAVPRGSTVLMEAPNGQRQAVSADQVNHYTQLGARVVG